MAFTIGSGSFKTVSETKEADNSDLTKDELVSRNIQKISHNVLQIKNMVHNIGTSLDSEELRHRMSTLQGETNQLTKDTNTAIREISVLDKTTDENEKKRLQVKLRFLKENFHDVLVDYNEVQKTAKTKQRQTIKHKLRDSVTQGEDFSVNSEGQEREAGAELQIQIVQGEVDLELVQEREEALKQLEQDIVDINIIFKDLATIVYDQGEVIDTIETNVHDATDDIEDGLKDLEKAVDYQSSARRKTFFVALLLVAVIVVIVIIIVVTVTQTT